MADEKNAVESTMICYYNTIQSARQLVSVSHFVRYANSEPYIHMIRTII